MFEDLGRLAVLLANARTQRQPQVKSKSALPRFWREMDDAGAPGAMGSRSFVAGTSSAGGDGFRG
jgi:hypothetical protein